MTAPRSGLPPGQRAVRGFPRFGVDTTRPPPEVPDDSSIEVVGDLASPLSLSATALAELARVEVTADFHCVAGWSALGQTWEGWSLAALVEQLVRPALATQASLTHLVFVGLDGYRSHVQLEDALAADVLIADKLDGRPLTAEHGAPVRLVSPGQYGFISTKHLCRIELYDAEPPARFHSSRSAQRALRTVRPHPRARVWREERHRYVPARLIRPIYRRLVPLPAPALGLSG